MADLRSRFIEDYAGGLLNVARQELSTTGEVLSQDGLTSAGTLFVEDGSGNKSGLKLGVSLVEALDPTTEMGVVNVRFADRTYAKIRDLKIFSTAIASAQAALSEASSLSITNLETTLQLLEDDINSLEQSFQTNLSEGRTQLQQLTLNQRTQGDTLSGVKSDVENLKSRVQALEIVAPNPATITPLSTTLNSSYFSGTIAVASGVVTGTNTSFDTELDVGSVFTTVDSSGREQEFTVASFDTDTPATRITVIPTNVTVTSGAKFRKPTDLEIKSKINEILQALRDLDFII